MTSSSYFRYPHLHQDLLTFVAQDDVWVAPLAGGRAWRVSAETSPPRNPRFTPDGKNLVWTVTRGAVPEVVTAPVDGGALKQLTHWGHAGTKVKGFTADGDVVVTSAFEQPDARLTWAYAVSVGDGQRRRLPYGPVDSVAFGTVVGDERPVVLSSVLSREPAAWKRYRGGTAGKLWIDADGSGEFARLLPEVDGNVCDPMWVSGRIAFLSDHEGHGNLYSVLPDGGNLQRHTDFEGFYVRHASTDGTRIVFESAGNLFVLNSLNDEAVQLEITLGATNQARSPRKLDVGKHLNEVVPSRDGRASVVESHGTVHWITHRDGPARVIAAEPGVRARLARPLDAGHVFYVADAGGEEALYIRALADPSPQSAPPAPADAAPLTAPAPADPEGESDGDAAQLPRPVSAHAVNGAVFDVPAQAAAPASQATADQAAAAPAAATAGQPEAAQADSGQDARELRRLDYPARTRAAEAVASPDGTKIAIGTESGEVLLVDVHDGSMELVAHTDAGAVEELVFSPDSAWLLWVEPLDSDERHSRLRMAAVDAEKHQGERIIELTDGRFADFGADFTPDGKYVAFLSRRSFDPVYDTHSFDLSFPVATKPFLIAMAATTPSPFGPSVDGAPHPEHAKDHHDAPVPTVAVDVAGLAARIIAVPVPQDRYTALSATAGGLLWLVERGDGATGDGLATTADKAAPARLDRFDFATGKVSRVVEELDDFRLSGDGKWIVTVHDEAVSVLPVGSKPAKDAADTVTVDLERIVLMLDPVRVWGQAFDEAWRLQRDFYYTPDMAGTDWNAVHARYRPIVERLGSHDDLMDLLWELHGELGTSHAYVTPATSNDDAAGQGYLGAGFVATPDGFAITDIMAGDSSDPQAYSPLAAAGVAVRQGEILEAVNGIPVPEQGPAVLLAGTAGKIVELTLRSAPGSGAGDAGAPTRRRVAVVPLKSEERLRYQEWVGANRAMVRKASKGAFGYLHVPDMMPRGWAQLHRDLDTETAADALVIDIRRNRGGHTSQLVAEVISRRMDAWCLARGQGPQIYPSQAPRGPVVILADEFAGSDGDIITAVAKLRGIGPVVGMRTWGGVVGIDGRFSLADGTEVTQPRYAFWFRDGQGFHVENFGVEPDIEVPFAPHDHMAGNDPQLEAAVGVLLEMLQEIPTVQPPALAGYRNVAPGALPPRP
ncbi:peptidase S41 [Arthrobacter sp. ERGS1:01]|uniref:S41 family peptidase n=1 Tax=Arthrobacter sp. ERGS1:01 TaxID=1704044 RepID=UPI0006B442CD|nr:S41 family peptidase [Arthrobacter sp. ERGS1:01]ALE05535.1 peptidase S41 [Arthrobacter sp. ERGS1:01]